MLLHDSQTSTVVEISHGNRPRSNTSPSNTSSPIPRYPRRTAQSGLPNNTRSTDIQSTSHHIHRTSTVPALSPVYRCPSSASSLFTTRLKKLFASNSQSSDNLTPLGARHDKARDSSGLQPPSTAVETLQAVRLSLHSTFEGLLGAQMVQGSALTDAFASMQPNLAAQSALGIFFNVTQAVQSAHAIKTQAMFLIHRIAIFFDTLACLCPDKVTPSVVEDLLRRLCRTLSRLEELLQRLRGLSLLRLWLSGDELTLTMRDLLAITPTPSEIFMIGAQVHRNIHRFEEPADLIKQQLSLAKQEDHRETTVALSQTSLCNELEQLLQGASEHDRQELISLVTAKLGTLRSPLGETEEKFLREMQDCLASITTMSSSPTEPRQYRTRLPTRPATFYGRRAAVDEIVSAVLHYKHIAILGHGGVGKTSCAREAIYDPQIITHFGTRRYFVRCDAAPSFRGFLSAVAITLGVIGGEGLEGEILRSLGSKAGPTLIVLDNFETPWEASNWAMLDVEEFLGELGSIEEVALLVTMRGKETPGNSVTWTKLPSITPLLPLSHELAREVFVDMVPCHKDDPDLEQLVASLDGLPLAIDLMAQVSETAPNLAVVRRRWEGEQTSMLQRRPDSADRETSLDVSLRLSIESSRMTSESRQLLQVLALLPDGIPTSDLDIIFADKPHDAAYALRRTSLAYDDDRQRLRILSPVRLFVLRQYPAPDALRRRVTDHYFQLARLGFDLFNGCPNGRKVVATITDDVGNITSLIHGELQSSQPHVLDTIEAALGLLEFFVTSGLGSEDLIMLSLQRPDVLANSNLQARIRVSLGRFLFHRSNYAECQAHIAQAIELLQGIGGDANKNLLGDCYYYQYLTTRYLEPNTGEACSTVDRSLAFYRETSNKGGEGWCLLRQGVSSWEAGKQGTALKYFRDAEALFRECRDYRGLANICVRLGDLALNKGDLDSAQKYLKDGLRLHRCAGDIRGEGHTIFRLGRIFEEQEEWDRAMEQFESAMVIFSKLRGRATTILAMGRVALKQFDDTVAYAKFSEAERLYRSFKDRRGQAYCYTCFGDLALFRQNHLHAYKFYKLAKEIFDDIGLARGIAQCTASLGDAMVGLAKSDPTISLDMARELYVGAYKMYEEMDSVVLMGASNIRLARIDTLELRARRIARTSHSYILLGRMDLVRKLQLGFPDLLETINSSATANDILQTDIDRSNVFLHFGTYDTYRPMVTAMEEQCT